MKKRNLIILIIVCIISLCVFAGLLAYAFNLQMEKDLKNQTDLNSESSDSVDLSKISPIPSISPSGSSEAQDDQRATEETSSNSISATPGPTIAPTKTPNITPTTTPEIGEVRTEPIVLDFAGDVNLDESNDPATKYDAVGKDITKCFSTDLLKEMKAADIMMLNNEFAYSTRGTKAPNKKFTFHANPARVEILNKMGVDIVSLANNHSLDYGPDALLDTFQTLEDAGIDYIGAGENLTRAMQPMYYTVDGMKIAYVAASRVVPVMEWYATDSNIGVLGTYDPSLILESIKEAKANSDFVVTFVHWGIERTDYPADYQRKLAQQFIDAGADAIIGCHPHVMQGVEFYKGKPIAYSLGNFWFNNSTSNSGMIKLYLEPDHTVKIQMLPVVSKNTVTYLLTKDADKKDYYNFIKGLSYSVNIDKDGFITETN